MIILRAQVANGLAERSTLTGNGTNDYLNASGDLSGATISGIETLVALGTVTLSAAEFNSFGAVEVSSLTNNSTPNAANDNYKSIRLLSRTA